MQQDIASNNKTVDGNILSCSNFIHALQIRVKSWSVVFKASVQVNQPSCYGKSMLDESKVLSFVIINLVINIAESRARRYESEGLGVDCVQWPY